MVLTDQDKLRQIALLLAQTIDAVVPLIQATQPQRSPLGSEIHRPDPNEVAASLLASANALREAFQ